MIVTEQNKKIASADIPFSFGLTAMGFVVCYRNFLESDYLGVLGGLFLLVLGIFWVWINFRILYTNIGSPNEKEKNHSSIS